MHYRIFRPLLLLFAALCLNTIFEVGVAGAQTAGRRPSTPTTSSRSGSNSRGGSSMGRDRNNDADSIKVPRGITTWKIDERFGMVTPTMPDTMPHLYQNSGMQSGLHGEYNHTGNLGSPRDSRIHDGQLDYMMGQQFLFTRPYSQVMNSIGDYIFTNTRAPITNLTWMTQGNKITGEDRLRALFATNVNSRTGIGAKVDYLYGRGYYNHQQQSSVGAKLYGSHRGDRYQIHGAYMLDRTRVAENGGLSDETYITHPEYFSTKYAPADMPVRLTSAYNNLKVNTLYLTHRYALGYYQLIYHDGGIHSVAAIERARALAADSTTRDQVDSTMLALATDTTLIRNFVSVAAFVHTARLDHSSRRYIDVSSRRDYYLNDYFEGVDSIVDMTRYLSVDNTFALEMSEGFRPWVKTGMRVFARHQFARFGLPDAQRHMAYDAFNYLSLGGQISSSKGRYFRYDALGELRTTGTDWGEFNVEGTVNFIIPIRKDSVTLDARGFVRNETPSYYYRHYHGAPAWWDNDDLDKIFRFRVAGELGWRKTRLGVAFENVQNHTFFRQMRTSKTFDEQGNPVLPQQPSDLSLYAYGAEVAQASHGVQILQATLGQDFRFGPLCWDNVLTLQKSTDQDVLPLPLFNVWTNLYLNFKIAKVLTTDLGADATFFTKYHAKAYVPFIGQYAVQDPSTQTTEIGGYPWVNVYANFHLKTCRFYVMFSHVNCMAGRYFLAPGFPTNQRTFRIGISWNFFN